MTGGRPLLRDDLAPLLRAALHPDLAEARAAWEAWRGTADLVEIDPAALRIAGLLADRLADLGAREDEAARLILWRVRFTWLRTVTLRKRVAPVLAALDARGIRGLLVKGPAVLHHVGGATAWRPMEDLDLLVDPADVGATAAVLEEQGFTSDFGAAFRNHPAYFEALHAVGFDDGEGGLVDLHWRGAHARRDPALERERFTGAVRGDLLGAPVWFPRAEEVLLQAVEHGAALAPAPDGAWAADVALLLRDGPALDWALVARLAAARRMGTAVRDAIDTVEQGCGIAAPPGAAAQLGPARPTLAQAVRVRRRPGPPGRVAGAVELLEEHATRTGRRRLGPGDPGRALATAWNLPSGTAAAPYALYAALGRPRRLRDRLVPARHGPGAPLALPLELDLTTAGGPAAWQHRRVGWSAPEAFGSWITGPLALALLPVDARAGAPLELTVRAGTALISPRLPTLRVRVLVDDVAVGEIALDAGRVYEERALAVPAGVVRGGTLALGFVPDRRPMPAELGINGDNRRLSAYVAHIAVRAPDTVPR